MGTYLQDQKRTGAHMGSRWLDSNYLGAGSNHGTGRDGIIGPCFVGSRLGRYGLPCAWSFPGYLLLPASGFYVPGLVCGSCRQRSVFEEEAERTDDQC